MVLCDSDWVDGGYAYDRRPHRGGQAGLRAADSISKYLLPYEEPKSGDIFAFRYPADISQLFVKRVIGLPGDHLKIVHQQVYINGKKLTEPYVYHKSSYLIPIGTIFRATFRRSTDVVPIRSAMPFFAICCSTMLSMAKWWCRPSRYFAMGDNRDNSLDSRYWGFVPRDYIVGKPVLIYWSYNTTTDMLMPHSAKGYDNHFAGYVAHFFSKDPMGPYVSFDPRLPFLRLDSVTPRSRCQKS